LVKKHNKFNVVIGHNVRQRRIAAGLSQQELGRKIGVTYQQVQKYEKGSNGIGASRLPQIADALGTAIPALFDGTVSAGGNECPAASSSGLRANGDAYRLALAFAAIDDAGLRRHIVESVERMARQRK
jgi:transcriptional regulator with XRE-family HTH domain